MKYNVDFTYWNIKNITTAGKFCHQNIYEYPK